MLPKAGCFPVAFLSFCRMLFGCFPVAFQFISGCFPVCFRLLSGCFPVAFRLMPETHLKANAIFEHPPPNPQTLEATMHSETRRPKRASLDAVSRATHLKTNSNFNTHPPTPKP